MKSLTRLWKTLRGTAEDVLALGMFLLVGWLLLAGPLWSHEPALVGVAKVDITPTEPVLLAGYGGRVGEFSGIDTRLWARVLVIGDAQPVAVIAVDNCGVTADITARVVAQLKTDGLTAERLNLTATHTHNAPTLTGYAPIVWQGRATADQMERVNRYTDRLVQQIVDVTREALGNRQKMRLRFARGRVGFGGNRRVLNDGKWSGFGFQRSGPVDHSLPVMYAVDMQDDVRAVWANYACHCTTVGSRNDVGGDWAGFANQFLEQEFPAAISLVTIGCGADIGPQPSGNLEIARQHGKTLAAAVKQQFDHATRPLTTAPDCSRHLVKLPLRVTRTADDWARLAGGNGFDAEHAKSMLQLIRANGHVPQAVDYPLTVWKFGDELAIVFLSGEVVVDYAVRLNQELDWNRLWVTAWANAMPGYIPSRRVLLEGGYEAEFSQIYYRQPGPYDLQVEEILAGAVRRHVGEAFHAAEDQPPAPFHALPSGEDAAFVRLAQWASTVDGEDARVWQRFRQLLPAAIPAVGKQVQLTGGAETEWYNFAGDTRSRRFVRQESLEQKIQWTTPLVQRAAGEVVLGFSGGLGWRSQAKTDGFSLRVDGHSPLAFDVTDAPTRWISSDRQTELVYLPTWRSAEDSAGFFLLRLEGRPAQANSVTVTVQSSGEKSLRWFAVDVPQAFDLLRPRLQKVTLGGVSP